MSGDVFRQQLMEIQDSNLPDSRLVERYKANIQKFRPVMRHFFTEKHKDPMAWFMMRLRYSRSVAVCSMVGHILGIGDRHLSNVMIDSNSGEIVQIDFGIVFGAVSTSTCGLQTMLISAGTRAAYSGEGTIPPDQ